MNPYAASHEPHELPLSRRLVLPLAIVFSLAIGFTLGSLAEQRRYHAAAESIQRENTAKVLGYLNTIRELQERLDRANAP